MDELQAGVLVLDKPQGMTSQTAVTRVRRLLGFAKAGHSGILDPDVTGVLPVLFGSSTRLAQYITDTQKSYEATVVFGFATDTQDASGQVIARGNPQGLDFACIAQGLKQFIGEIEQLPPQYSALKISGVRAYALARQGLVAPLEKRIVHVLSVDLLSVERRVDTVAARFAMTCKKGTYVRTVCHDLGDLLGVPAHMERLVRTQSGPFSLANAHTLDDVEVHGRALLLPPESAVPTLPVLHATWEQTQRVFHGARFWRHDLSDLAVEQDVRVHGESGQLLAIYTVLQVVAGKGVELAAKKVLALQEATQ